MKRIESSSNPRIKALARMIHRGDFRERYIVEGRILFLDALSCGVKFREVYVRAPMLRELRPYLEQIESETDVFEVPESLMKALTTVDTPPGVVGVALHKSLEIPTSIETFAALLLSVRDPGNLGALLRSAEAAGCEFIACSQDCADARQPKVVRASMGSIFREPVFKVPQPVAYASNLQQSGITIYTLVPKNGEDLYRWKPRFPALVVIGGEASGIPNQFKSDDRITIPMKGRVESLNAAMAGTLCFYRMAQELS